MGQFVFGLSAAMSTALESKLELAHSIDLVLQYTPSNNPMCAKTTLKDARIHPHA